MFICVRACFIMSAYFARPLGAAGPTCSSSSSNMITTTFTITTNTINTTSFTITITTNTYNTTTMCYYC